MCADTDVVLVRMVAGTALVASLINSRQLVMLVMAEVVIVVFVTVNMAVRVRQTKSLPCHRRMIVVARVSTRAHAAAGKLLNGKGHEHHE